MVISSSITTELGGVSLTIGAEVEDAAGRRSLASKAVMIEERSLPRVNIRSSYLISNQNDFTLEPELIVSPCEDGDSEETIRNAWIVTCAP